MSRKADKAMLVERQGGLCFYCDAPMTALQGPRLATVDHVTPKPEGGSDDLSNKVAACHQCNRMKGCMTVEQIRRLADRVELAAFASGARSMILTPYARLNQERDEV